MANNFQADGAEPNPDLDAQADVAGGADSQGRSKANAPKSAPKNRGAPRMGRASKLRLLARLHGQGRVVWPGASVAVTYDVDIFGGGVTQTASGFLEGDFAAAHGAGQDEAGDPAPSAARLRLEDGSEVAVQIVVVASDLAEFEAPLSSAEVDRLSSPR
jgi:hypothetical protein